MKKSIAALALTAALAVGVVATGCSNSGSGNGKASVTFLNSKGEIATQLEAAVKQFNSTNKDGITVTVSSVASSSTVDETMLSKYASGNPATISMVDPADVQTFADKSLDLSNESWVKNITDSIKPSVEYNGNAITFPLNTTEK